MGLFNHNKKKDVIIGPSGYAYTNEEGEEDSHRRTSTSSAASNPRRSVDQSRTSVDESPRKSTDSRAGVGAAGTAGAVAAGAAGAAGGKRNSIDKNDVNRTSQGEKFTSGVLPQSPTRSTPQAQTSPSTIGNSSSERAGGEGAQLGNSPRARIVETAKAPHVHPGRERDSVLSEEDAKNAEHDHKYLQPVVHERVHRHHVEEIETHRMIERHVHHVQHHIQPIIDEQHTEEVHLFREVPVTSIKENHAMSDEDRALFDRLNIGAGTTTIIPHEKVVVNKGETMRTETIIHHVHHIVQPIWQRDLHEYFRLNPPNPAQAAPYSTSYTGPATLGTSYYPETANSNTARNPASIAVQHGQAQSVGGSIPHPHSAGGAQVREGHKLVPIEGSRHEMHYVNREPAQSVHSGRTEVFPTRQEQHGSVALPQTNTAPYQTSSPTSSLGNAGPTAAASHTVEAERAMRNLSLGVAQ
ncbi:hypothetical protein JCM3765_002450 [Sporobolomyces pararoseus]